MLKKKILVIAIVIIILGIGIFVLTRKNTSFEDAIDSFKETKSIYVKRYETESKKYISSETIIDSVLVEEIINIVSLSTLNESKWETLDIDINSYQLILANETGKTISTITINLSSNKSSFMKGKGYKYNFNLDNLELLEGILK